MMVPYGRAKFQSTGSLDRIVGLRSCVALKPLKQMTLFFFQLVGNMLQFFCVEFHKNPT